MSILEECFDRMEKDCREDKWDYLQEKHGYTRLVEDGGYWYAK